MKLLTQKKWKNIQTLIDGVRERNKNLRKENKQLLQAVHLRDEKIKVLRAQLTKKSTDLLSEQDKLALVRGVCYAMDAEWTSVEIAPEISDTGAPELDYIIATAKGQAPRALREEERLAMQFIQMIKEMK